MKERRWDIVLRVVSGPLASRQAVSYRGPQVTVGVDPGPGGVVLPGGRGVAPRHCTIAAYDPHTIFVTPVGHNPVRIAPYAEVNWDQIEPIRDQVRLERGNALHLGPSASRGITLEFVECHDLGLQSTVRIASEAAGDTVLPRPPDAIQAKRQPRVTSLLADAVPRSRFQQYLYMLVGMSLLMVLAATGILIARMRATSPEKLPPRTWSTYDFALAEADLTVHEGFQAPFWDFVLSWNAELARGINYPELDQNHPELWDRMFFGTVEQMTRRAAASRHVFKRLEQVKDQYAFVVQQLDDADVPEVLAAVPMLESCYKPNLSSPCCAYGYWQWMPQAGPRFSALFNDPSYRVAQCPWKESPGKVFNPVAKAPPPRSCSQYGLGDTNTCKFSTCKQDFRGDLEKSTRASIYALEEALRDKELAGSGAAVQITIASHNAGYDDTRLRKDVTVGSKRYNLLHAYRRWYRGGKATAAPPNFYGDVMQCVKENKTEGCQTYMMAETQLYSPRVVSDHLLAVCYYATHYPHIEQFGAWGKYLKEGGYCRELEIPSPSELKGMPSSRWCH